MTARICLSALLSAMMLAASPTAMAQSQAAAATGFDSRLTAVEWDHAEAPSLLQLSAIDSRRSEFEAAAAAGNTDAMTLLGVDLIERGQTDADRQRGIEMALAAANKGHVRAMSLIAMVLLNGSSVQKDPVEGMRWLRKAADAGNGLAQGRLAVEILNKVVEPRTPNEAFDLMEKAAGKGIVWAMTNAGDMVYNGDGTAKDLNKSREWHERAARLGSTGSLAAAGALAWLGENQGSVQRFRGFAQLEVAARSGDIDAIQIVSQAYLGNTPHLDLANPQAAVELLEAARRATEGKNATINQLLSTAKSTQARAQQMNANQAAWLRQFNPSSGQNVRSDPSPKQVVDGIVIREVAWPTDIPQPQLASIAGDRSPVDEYGISEREWRELTAAQFASYAMMPEGLRRIAAGFARRDPKAMTLVAVISAAAKGSLDLSSAYPKCAAANNVPAYCDGLGLKLGQYLGAAGFGDYAVSRDGLRVGRIHTRSIGALLRGQPSMRAQLEAQLDEGTYNDQQIGRMMIFAELGYLPAIQYLKSKASDCGGDSAVRRYLVNNGKSERGLVETAASLGDAAMAFEYAERLRNAYCVGRDPAGALKLYKTAADLGHMQAKYQLMMMYTSYGPDGATRNYREALRLAREIEKQTGQANDPRLMAQIQTGAQEEARSRALIGYVTDDPAKAPNAATIRAVMMRELKWTMDRFSGISFMGMLGNPPYQVWNYEDGKFVFETQNPGDLFQIHYSNDFSVSGAACTPAAGTVRAYNCSYSTSAFLDYRIGKVTLFNGGSPRPTRQQARFEFIDGEWRSPAIRAQIMASMKAGPGPVGGGPQNGLCKSLYAGVVATGGKVTDRALDPNTWGC